MNVRNTKVPQCDTCWMVTREVKSSNRIGVYFSCFVFFFTAFSFSVKKLLWKGSVCVSVSCIKKNSSGAFNQSFI